MYCNGSVFESNHSIGVPLYSWILDKRNKSIQSLQHFTTKLPIVHGISWESIVKDYLVWKLGAPSDCQYRTTCSQMFRRSLHTVWGCLGYATSEENAIVHIVPGSPLSHCSTDLPGGYWVAEQFSKAWQTSLGPGTPGLLIEMHRLSQQIFSPNRAVHLFVRIFRHSSAMTLSTFQRFSECYTFLLPY